ncbi:glycosyltransferase family 2 protein [Tsukamurella soli]
MGGVSVVVPAYNEEDCIEDCILRLLGQGECVREIIVVDNNSADKTAEIVRRLVAADPRVVLIAESRQGAAFARSTGFDQARCDIIARVDADSVVGPGWAGALAGFLEGDVGAEFDLVSTPVEFRMPGRRFQAALNRWDDPFNKYRDRPQSIDYALGCSMAMRRSAWLRIRSLVNMRRDIFDDIDMALCVIDTGGSCALLRSVVVEVSGRRFYNGVARYAAYAAWMPRTYRLHRRWRKSALLYAGLPVSIAFHAARLVYLRRVGAAGDFALRDPLDRAEAERVRP